MGQPHAPVGIFFFSLEATSLCATLGARSLFSLPYHIATMQQVPWSNSLQTQHNCFSSAQLWSQHSVEIKYAVKPQESHQLACQDYKLAQFLCEVYCMYKTFPGHSGIYQSIIY